MEGFMNFFTRQGRTFLLAVVLAVGVVCLSGCGGDKELLMGQWVSVEEDEDDDGETGLELLKDGTGVRQGVNITWKIEKKRLVMTMAGVGLSVSCDYKVSPYELTLEFDDRGSEKYEREEVYMNRGGVDKVLNSFESAYLASLAESNGKKITFGDLLFELPKGDKIKGNEYWVYSEITDNGGMLVGLMATAKGDMQGFLSGIKKGDYLKTEYKTPNGCFEHKSNNDAEINKVLSLAAFDEDRICESGSDNNSQASAPTNQQSGGNGGEQENATAELEKEATAWVKGGGGVTTEEEEGLFFKFNGFAGEGVVSWTATSKKAIGDCPAGSAWGLSYDHEDGTKSSNFPPKCKSITPKVIIDFK
jgi:hypothetical protein